MTAAKTGPYRVEYEGTEGVFVADVATGVLMADVHYATAEYWEHHHRLADLLRRLLATGELTCAREVLGPDDDLLSIGGGGRFAFKLGTLEFPGPVTYDFDAIAVQVQAKLNELAAA